jgi:hypothetical protein
MAVQTDNKFTIQDYDVPWVLDWIEKRGGLAVWESRSQACASEEAWLTPVLMTNGQRKPKPTWQSPDNPTRVITDLHEIVVETPDGEIPLLEWMQK